MCRILDIGLVPGGWGAEVIGSQPLSLLAEVTSPKENGFRTGAQTGPLGRLPCLFLAKAVSAGACEWDQQ